MMHDASHYALFLNSRYNNYASILWNSLSTWNHNVWLYHHVLYHHSFTSTAKDPDIHHYMPMYSKALSSKSLELPLWMYPVLSYTIPGMVYGQGLIAYLVQGTMFGYVFQKELRIPRFKYSLFDMCLIVFRFFSLSYGFQLSDFSYGGM